MKLSEILSRKDEICSLASRHGAGNVRVFGSVLHGEETATSDIDFLIDVTGKTSSWFPSGLVLDLEDLLGSPVDVVTERSLHPALRERIVREAKRL